MKPSNNKPSPETVVNTKKVATASSNPLPSVPPVNLDTNDLFKNTPQKNKPKAPTTDIPNIDFNFTNTTPPPVLDDLPPIPNEEPVPKNKKKSKEPDDNPFSFGYFLKAKDTPQAPNLDTYQVQLNEMTQRALNAEAQLLETQRALKELKEKDKEETKALVEMMQVVEQKLLLATERANKAELMVKELEKKSKLPDDAKTRELLQKIDWLEKQLKQASQTGSNIGLQLYSLADNAEKTIKSHANRT